MAAVHDPHEAVKALSIDGIEPFNVPALGASAARPEPIVQAFRGLHDCGKRGWGPARPRPAPAQQSGTVHGMLRDGAWPVKAQGYCAGRPKAVGAVDEPLGRARSVRRWDLLVADVLAAASRVLVVRGEAGRQALAGDLSGLDSGSTGSEVGGGIVSARGAIGDGTGQRRPASACNSIAGASRRQPSWNAHALATLFGMSAGPDRLVLVVATPRWRRKPLSISLVDRRRRQWLERPASRADAGLRGCGLLAQWVGAGRACAGHRPRAWAGLAVLQHPRTSDGDARAPLLDHLHG